MKEELIDAEFNLSNEGRSSVQEEIPLNFHFKLSANNDRDWEASLRIMKPAFDASKKGVVTFFVLTLVFAGLGYLQTDQHKSDLFMYGVSAAFLFFSIIITRQLYKERKTSLKMVKEALTVGAEHEAFEIIINEEIFGQNTYMGITHFNWTHEVNILVTEEDLIIMQWKNGHNQICITKEAVGEEVYKNVVLAVQQKLKRLRAET